MTSWNWKAGDWACCIVDPSVWFDDATGAPPVYQPARGEILKVSEVKITKYRRPVWWKFWIAREQDVALRFAGLGLGSYRSSGFRKIERAETAFSQAIRSLAPAKQKTREAAE